MSIPGTIKNIFIRRRRLFTGLIKYGLILSIILFVLDMVVFPFPIEKLSRKQAHFIYDRDGKLLNCFASSDHFWRKSVKLKDISPELQKTIISYEDKWFYYHPGINPVSILSAAWTNLKKGKIVRGGSTITMQIARMIEPRPRTFLSKSIEILRSFQLELHYSKDELLEYYFNLVPYGGNIEGVGAATYFYFEKEPNKLSLSESAILAAIPPSPNNFRPDLNPEKCLKRRNIVLSYLLKSDAISRDKYDDAINEEIPVSRMKRPFHAPHFSQSILGNFPDSPVIRTTIQYDKQILCERLAYNHHLSLLGKSIYNLSVVVLDNKSGELISSVGSPDFNDRSNNGQINGTLSLRSPGSALKPFAYALGFDQGLLTPSTMLDDIPVNYAGYSPENYDEEYHGLVSVRDALIQSLNVPAVNVCAEIGLNNFYTFLKDGGISSLNRKYFEYGLPLVLGACELSLLDISNLYATLAREGEYLPVRFLADQKDTVPKKILSEEACYLISSIISNLARPGLASSWEFTKDIPTVAWKTGTSYGRKDAWAIGYNPEYTIGVWVGNFSAEGSPYLVGAETAAPLMLNIFHELTAGREIKWFDPPPDIEVRLVCTKSGLPPNDDCPSTREDYFIYGVSSPVTCTVHRTILVDHESGHMVCPACSFGAVVDTVLIEDWSARISDWLLRQGQAVSLPRHNPNCMGMANSDPPVIHSPEKNGLYEIRAGASLEFQKLMFQASVSLSSSKIHWFLDNNWYATCQSGTQLFYLPEKGKHELVCMDEFGRSSRISFEVR